MKLRLLLKGSNITINVETASPFWHMHSTGGSLVALTLQSLKKGKKTSK